MFESEFIDWQQLVLIALVSPTAGELLLEFYKVFPYIASFVSAFQTMHSH